MTLKIISAEDVLFEGDVTIVTLPGVMGLFTILNNHASLVSTLTAGDVVYESNGKTESLKIAGGIVDVDNNIVSVCIY